VILSVGKMIKGTEIREKDVLARVCIAYCMEMIGYCIWADFVF